jgi:hypothetical protein
MTNPLRSKWLDALRSGTYVQTRGVLHENIPSGKAYCALGVLLYVALGNETPEEPLLMSTEIDEALKTAGVAARLTLRPDSPVRPRAVSESTYPDSLDQDFDDGAEITIIDLNDSYDLSFGVIADLIEEEYGR